MATALASKTRTPVIAIEEHYFESANHRPAQRGILLATLAKTECHGKHANNHRERGHNDGAHSGVARFNRGADRIQAFGHPFARKRDQKNAVCRCHSHAHHSTSQRGDAQGGMRQEQNPKDTCQGSRQSRDDDERIEPGLEIDNDKQVDQHDRHHQPDQQAGVR